MNIPSQQAYFMLTIPFMIIWVLLYVFNKRTRKEQLMMSLMLIPLGTLTEILYFQDYWRPLSILQVNIGPIWLLLEDFLFVFAISGIGAVMYEILFHKRIAKKKKNFHKKYGLFTIIIISILLTLALFYLGINSIFATTIGFAVFALLIILQRRDLLADSLLSGLCVMLTLFVAYTIFYNFITNTEEIVKQQWLLYGTPLDKRIFNIPFTELIWGFSAGMFVGPLYAFIKNLTLKS